MHHSLFLDHVTSPPPYGGDDWTIFQVAGNITPVMFLLGGMGLYLIERETGSFVTRLPGGSVTDTNACPRTLWALNKLCRYNLSLYRITQIVFISISQNTHQGTGGGKEFELGNYRIQAYRVIWKFYYIDIIMKTIFMEFYSGSMQFTYFDILHYGRNAG